ncbi:MAG: NAD(P)/FAD-dependent oxidoreductase [Burkholderiales bacterium]
MIGAGVIGSSAASRIAKHCNVVLFEQESQAGYHSSGRSAAVLLPSYGGPLVRALTAASTEFFSDPPDGFSHFPILTDRGAIFVAKDRDELSLLDRWGGERRLTAVEAVEIVPILNVEKIVAAAWLPGVKDIDAAGLLQGFLKSFRAQGGVALFGVPITSIKREEGEWTLETKLGSYRARVLVNAAGAWADQVADLAGAGRKGFVPTRRTIAVVDPPAGVDVLAWPLVSDAAETFYFKSEGGRLAICPGDRTPVEAQDVQPEDLDIAIAVDRFESVTDMSVRRVVHKWAGLRTYAPDNEPVIGFDPDVPNFFWAAGFGGFGIQTAAAVGPCCEALICRQPLPASWARFGVALERLSPRRLARSSCSTAST